MVAIQVSNGLKTANRKVESPNDNDTSRYIRSLPYLCNELSFVNVQIGSADTAGLHLDQDIVVTELWQRDLDDSVLFRLRVPANERLLARTSF